MKVDQTIGGTALNLLAGSLAIFIAKQSQANHAVQISYDKSFRLNSGF